MAAYTIISERIAAVSIIIDKRKGVVPDGNLSHREDQMPWAPGRISTRLPQP
jgi:hypothetical protein